MSKARLLPYLWYPLFGVLAMGLFGLLLATDHPLLFTLYAPICFVGPAVVGLQTLFPERRAWRPRWADIRADTLYMVVVQLLLPELFVVCGVLSLADWLHARIPSYIWPQGWPLTAQVVLMILVVDFFRYWLHRACHRYSPLWRLHKVHHAPEILYSLNVGRFHPLEKALHYSLDTVPFLVLGVAPQVLAGYFLAYAVNGFFQHSNVKLRYGWLNYVVGSAETHRWHHARDPRIAACNFGNTVILWDLLFGTWYLPRGRKVGAVGITDRGYPQGFWQQLWVPFQRGVIAVLVRRGADLLMAAHLCCIRFREGRRLASLARDPMRRQHRLLMQIVRENRATRFGREHGFDGILDLADYRRRVPVREYEALRPYVEAGRRELPALTREAPRHYLRTSGTTGKPKDIPLTASHLEAQRRTHTFSVACQQRQCPEAFRGAILAVHSPAREGVLTNGKPYGAASGVVVESTPALVRDKLVVPPEVFGVADPRLKYRLILRLALSRSDISYIGTANGSTFLALMQMYRECREELVADVARGGFSQEGSLEPAVRAAIESRLEAQPGRAAALQALPPAARLGDLWPGVRLVVVWTGGSAGVALDALRRELPAGARIMELGYQASEFRGTVTLGAHAGTGLPTLDTHFFEFVERERWDRGEPEFLTLDQLHKGVDYHIIVTTPSGLYRYFMNDLVRVTGVLHHTPLLKFVQKGKGVTSLTGEKLYEAQALEAVQGVLACAGRAARYLMMLADEGEARYQLYLELEDDRPLEAADLASRIDARLQTLNLEYAAKRESRRLGPLNLHRLKPATGEAHKRHCVERGQRESQFKTVAIAYRKSFDFDFTPHLMED